MAKEVILDTSKIKKWQTFGRRLKLTVLLLLLLLIAVYIALKLSYDEGSFVVNLANNEALGSGLALYESQNDPSGKRLLTAESLQFMTNISIKWLPPDIDTEAEGSHNGDDYIAYTFYIENQSDDVFSYWYEMFIDDVTKDVDEALRVMIIVNGDRKVYAKGDSIDRKPEKGTIMFRDDEDGSIILEQRKNMSPNDIDRITIVIWIEGDDPECINSLIGGHLKMHMDITEEHINSMDRS